MEGYNSTSLAYDLSRFSRPQQDETPDRISPRQKPQIKQNPAVRKEKPAAQTGIIDGLRGMDRTIASARRGKLIKTVAFCASMMVMLGTVVYNQAQLSELNRDITRAEKSIVAMEGEYARKSVELEQRINLNTTEDVATNTLGMTEMDSTQIQYVSLGQDKTVSALAEEKSGNIFSKIGNFFAGLFTNTEGE